jgi:hypothetical protein
MKKPTKTSRNPALTALDFVRDVRQPMKDRVRTALSLMRRDPDAALPHLKEFLNNNIGSRLRSRVLNTLERSPGRGIKKVDREFAAFKVRADDPKQRADMLAFAVANLVPGMFTPQQLTYLRETYGREWQRAADASTPEAFAASLPARQLADRRARIKGPVLEQILHDLRTNRKSRLWLRAALAQGSAAALPEERAVLDSMAAIDKIAK